MQHLNFSLLFWKRKTINKLPIGDNLIRSRVGAGGQTVNPPRHREGDTKPKLLSPISSLSFYRAVHSVLVSLPSVHQEC